MEIRRVKAREKLVLYKSSDHSDFFAWWRGHFSKLDLEWYDYEEIITYHVKHWYWTSDRETYGLYFMAKMFYQDFLERPINFYHYCTHDILYVFFFQKLFWFPLHDFVRPYIDHITGADLPEDFFDIFKMEDKPFNFRIFNVVDTKGFLFDDSSRITNLLKSSRFVILYNFNINENWLRKEIIFVLVGCCLSFNNSYFLRHKKQHLEGVIWYAWIIIWLFDNKLNYLG